MLMAAGISFVSIQMQSIIARSNSTGVSIEVATAQLASVALSSYFGQIQDVSPVPEAALISMSRQQKRFPSDHIKS